jgi:hypothetical protein
MKWTDCTPDNTEFTDRYDAAVRKIRKKIGSFDKIAQVIFRDTGNSVAGVSVRRWWQGRDMPIRYICTLVDAMEGDIDVLDFFPYLEPYFEDDEDFLS